MDSKKNVETQYLRLRYTTTLFQGARGVENQYFASLNNYHSINSYLYKQALKAY